MVIKMKMDEKRTLLVNFTKIVTKQNISSEWLEVTVNDCCMESWMQLPYL